MSKFIDAFRVALVDGGNPRIPREMSVKVEREKLTPATYHLLRQWDFGVEWKIRTHCRDKDVENMHRNVLSLLRAQVYGEFRESLLNLERAYYEDDRETVERLIRDLFKETGA